MSEKQMRLGALEAGGTKMGCAVGSGADWGERFSPCVSACR